jgi:hypothetical protein
MVVFYVVWACLTGVCGTEKGRDGTFKGVHLATWGCVQINIPRENNVATRKTGIPAEEEIYLKTKVGVSKLNDDDRWSVAYTSRECCCFRNDSFLSL